MKPMLFTMLGYPGSGKSHFAKQLAREIKAVWLNNDGLRSSMFTSPTEPANLHNYPVIYGALDYAAQAVLDAGYSAIYDANVNHTAERLKNAQLAQAHGAQAVTIWVKTSVEEAVQRIRSREVTKEQFRFDQATVNKHLGLLEEPTAGEHCIVVDGTLPFDDQLAQFKKQLVEFQK